MELEMSVKADAISKVYWRNNRRFAALCNAVLFDGRDVIHEDNIFYWDTEETNIIVGNNFIISDERRRDLIRKVMVLNDAVLIGIENQQYKDKMMPLRDMEYTFLNYKNQAINEKNKLKPVFMIVLFYGEYQWKKNSSLSEMVEMPVLLREQFNDWRPIIVDVKNYDYRKIKDKEVRECFQAIQRIHNWKGRNEIFKGLTLTKESALFVSVVTHCVKLQKLVEKYREEEVDMCLAFDRVLEAERAKTREEDQLRFNKVLEREREKIKEEDQLRFNKVLEKEKAKIREEDQLRFNKVLEEKKVKYKVDVLIMQMKKKLGLISKEIIVMINQANDEQLEQLAVEIFDINSENDIIRILS